MCALLTSLASAEKYKFGVLSDMHLQPNYLPNRPANQYCEKAKPGEPDILEFFNAYFGRWGCDAPQLMLESAMQKLAMDHPDLKFLLAPGDLIGHEISIDLDKEKDLTDEQVQDRYN